MVDSLTVSVMVYVFGGVWALATNDPRIAASITTIAYIILLVGGR